MADTQWLYRALEEAGVAAGAHGGVAELARRTGVPRQTLTKILSGGSDEPTVPVCRALAGVMGWSTIQVMESFGILGREDLKVVGNGRPMWEPAQSRASHFSDAEVLLREVETYVGRLQPADRGPHDYHLIARCAQIHAILAAANTRDIAVEEL